MIIKPNSRQSPLALSIKVYASVLALLFALVQIALLYPGQFSFDSVAQLAQAHSGNFDNVSPVAMTALWSLLLRLGAPDSIMLFVNIGMFWLALGLLAVAFSAHRIVWSITLIAFAFSPFSMMLMGRQLTDPHLAAVMMLALALLCLAVMQKRRSALWLSMALLAYAGCIRHNAIFAILPFAWICATQLWPSKPRRWLLGFLRSVGLLFVAILIAQILDQWLVHERKTVWPTVALWDLAAVSVRSNKMLLPEYTRGPTLTVQELLETAAYTPVSNTQLFSRTQSGMRSGLDGFYSPEQLQDLRTVWLSSIWNYPRFYLQHRQEYFWQLIGPMHHAEYGQIRRINFQYEQTDSFENPRFPVAWMASAQQQLHKLSRELESTWFFAGWPYLLICLVSAILAVVNYRRSEAQIAIAVAISALLYTASFFILGPGAEIRYLSWPVIAAPFAFALMVFSYLDRSNERWLH